MVSSAENEENQVEKPLWRKILYERQPYPDNYTDADTFLSDLRKNGIH
jgi:phosphatidylinositol glycan class C protein